ncbi:MAG: flagellar hook capping protein [Opitutales bacterium]|nr:flagellar hook capping protein [Opitutales bacterium]
MDITALQSAAGFNTTGNTQQTGPSNDLGMFDFLKLLTVQMSNQDPLSPMDDMDFIAQMAQFSSLQEMSRMNNQFSALRDEQSWISAQQFIGKEVTFVDSDGNNQKGVVNGSSREGKDIFLRIEGNQIPITSVHQVNLVNS